MQNIEFASSEVIEAAAQHHHSYTFDSQDIFMTLILKSRITKSWTKRMYKITSLIHKLQRYYQTSTPPIKIIIIPTALKKQLPKTGNQIIGINECNSGATISYGYKDKYIIIWREEELEKVLIHEFIHYYGLDSPKEYREAYTETLATVWYAKDIKRQYRHRMKTLAKLMRYWYGKNYPEITKSRPFPKDIKEKVSKKTSVIEYYWITAAMLYQIVRGAQKKKIDIIKKMNEKQYVKVARKAVRDIGFQTDLKRSYEKILKIGADRSLRMTLQN